MRQIEEIIILASHNVGQIGENGSIAILPIQTDHRPAQGKSLSFHIPTDHLYSLPQLSPVLAVTFARCPGKRAEPLVHIDLEHGGPGPNSFPSFAPCIARGTDLIRTALCGWQIRCGWQCTLTCTYRVSSTSNTSHCVPCRSHSPPVFPPSPAGEQRGLRETRCAMPQLQLD